MITDDSDTCCLLCSFAPVALNLVYEEDYARKYYQTRSSFIAESLFKFSCRSALVPPGPRAKPA